MRTDTDHYFTKKYYPLLAVRPYNLMPLCHLCNSAVKREEDPLDGGKGRRRSLRDVCSARDFLDALVAPGMLQ